MHRNVDENIGYGMRHLAFCDGLLHVAGDDGAEDVGKRADENIEGAITNLAFCGGLFGVPEMMGLRLWTDKPDGICVVLI